MPERARDWLRQARKDVDLARLAAEGGHHEWACFAAQQAAEKAVQAVFQKLHQEAWGHVLHQLLDRLPDSIAVPEEISDLARQLDRHYVPTRYPNGFESGAPGDFFTRDDSERAIEQAEVLIGFCEGHLA